MAVLHASSKYLHINNMLRFFIIGRLALGCDLLFFGIGCRIYAEGFNMNGRS